MYQEFFNMWDVTEVRSNCISVPRMQFLYITPEARIHSDYTHDVWNHTTAYPRK